ILWFWILLLAAFNIGDFISWILRIVRVDGRSAYVRRKLAMGGANKSKSNGESSGPELSNVEEKRMIRSFVRDYLHEDGCFA
ncbi:unnamed protein product, partial [Rotaria socialis]